MGKVCKCAACNKETQTPWKLEDGHVICPDCFKAYIVPLNTKKVGEVK